MKIDILSQNKFQTNSGIKMTNRYLTMKKVRRVRMKSYMRARKYRLFPTHTHTHTISIRMFFYCVKEKALIYIDVHFSSSLSEMGKQRDGEIEDRSRRGQ